MSRSGYGEYYDDIFAVGRWRGIVASATRGKRGQAFFRELILALDEMPKKRLITNELRKDGEVCALGALGVKKGIKLEEIDPEDCELVAAQFNIAEQLAREVVYTNDECYSRLTPEDRWTRMRTWAENSLNKVVK